MGPMEAELVIASTSQTGSKDVRRCYICNKLRYVAKFCKVSNLSLRSTIVT